MLTNAILRARYRPLGDTAAVQVDLPQRAIVATVRDDHDLDQVREWVELTDGSLVLHSAQILHVSALLDADLLDLPSGAHDALRALCVVPPTPPDASDCPQLAIHCPLDTLTKPNAPKPRP